jgi:curved DNA-binding protein CbpA
VRTARRELAMVWRPDRFRHDGSKLQARATARFAAINAACERLLDARGPRVTGTSDVNW